MDPWRTDLTGVVELPSGRRIRGRRLGEALLDSEVIPQFGLYLTSNPHHESGWDSRWVCWPDFRLPRSASDAVAALAEAYGKSAVMRVEIACAGGSGRTGTAIALLARYDGVPAEEAVAWARANYRASAVETPWQRGFVRHAELAP